MDMQQLYNIIVKELGKMLFKLVYPYANNCPAVAQNKQCMVHDA